MQTLNSKRFGIFFQETNVDKIFSISWSEGDDIDCYSPKFFFFDTVEDILRYFKRVCITPFVLAKNNNDLFTKENTILLFDDDNLEIKTVMWKSSGTIFQFFNEGIYQKLKQALSESSIPL